MSSFRALIDQLGAADMTVRAAARDELLRQDEDIVDLLIADYYAGLPQAVAAEVIGILGEIGGWEALNLLGDVYYSRETRPILKAAARRALLRNADNLDAQQAAQLREDEA